MFARIFEYRFISIDQAKIAANHCSKEIGDQIDNLNIQSLSITIGKCASLSIVAKFESNQDLKSFEAYAQKVILQLRKTFDFKEGGFPGVMVYNYESEASLEQIVLN